MIKMWYPRWWTGNIQAPGHSSSCGSDCRTEEPVVRNPNGTHFGEWPYFSDAVSVVIVFSPLSKLLPVQERISSEKQNINLREIKSCSVCCGLVSGFICGGLICVHSLQNLSHDFLSAFIQFVTAEFRLKHKLYNHIYIYLLVIFVELPLRLLKVCDIRPGLDILRWGVILLATLYENLRQQKMAVLRKRLSFIVLRFQFSFWLWLLNWKNNKYYVVEGEDSSSRFSKYLLQTSFHLNWLVVNKFRLMTTDSYKERPSAS